MFCFHKYKEVKTQISKSGQFGPVDLPGYRLIEECIKCGKIRYVPLNIAMPFKYLHDEDFWTDTDTKM